MSGYDETKVWERGLPLHSASTNLALGGTSETATIQDRPHAHTPKVNPWKITAPPKAIPKFPAAAAPTPPTTANPISRLSASTIAPEKSSKAAPPKVSPWAQLPKLDAMPQSFSTVHLAPRKLPARNPQHQTRQMKTSCVPPLHKDATDTANTGEHLQEKKQKPAIRSPSDTLSKNLPIGGLATAPFLPSSSYFLALGPVAPPSPAVTLLKKKKPTPCQPMTNEDITEPSQADQPKKSTTVKGKTGRKKRKKQPVTQQALSGPRQPKKVPAVMDSHHGVAVVSASLTSFPGGATAGGDGAQFDLLRLYNDGKMVVHKGRQRVRPRKKKFTSLKKKVLEERLRKWKELQNESEKNAEQATASTDPSAHACFKTVCLYGYCEHDELVDDDEYEEIVVNLLEMARKIGSVQRVFIPRLGKYDEGGWPSFVDFKVDNFDHTTAASAGAAVECWNGLVLGGQKLKCRPLTMATHIFGELNNLEDEVKWREWCMSAERSTDVQGQLMNKVQQADSAALTTVILLKNALTEDDLDDEDCLEESLNDIRMLASKFGQVESIDVDMEATPPHLQIRYSGDVRNAAAELSKVVIGGQQVVAEIVSPCNMEPLVVADSGFFVRLKNVLTEDDLDDEDCLEESLNDVRELALQFGVVHGVVVDKSDNSDITDADQHSIRVYFSTIHETEVGARGFDGMVIGGLPVSASLSKEFNSKLVATTVNDSPSLKQPKTMFSGDKIIPERFAECKRVPKIANQEATRKYATLAADETIKPLLVEMLGELTRLQRRAVEDKNAKARRRIVMGLREVARGIRSHKVKMVVMANNLDEYGIIDKTLQDIIDLSNAEDIPVFYELNKRALGKALGKSIKVSVAGVQNADGAHQQYKKLVNYASKMS